MSIISNNGNPEFPSDNVTQVNSLAQLHLRDVELLKSPFRIADMAIELQAERMKVAEVLQARDEAVYQLADACTSIRQKTELIQRFEQEKSKTVTLPSYDLETDSNNVHSLILESIIRGIRTEIQLLRERLLDTTADEPLSYEEGSSKYLTENARNPSKPSASSPEPSTIPSIPNLSPSPSHLQTLNNITLLLERIQMSDTGHAVLTMFFKQIDPEAALKARYAVLAGLPIPPEIPTEALKPIELSPPLTLNEFLNGASGNLKNALSNYIVFPNVTTQWCPEREEHGFLYAPAFKCSTNPRVSTAHRWSAVDVVERMDKPTECFYNKEGLWYYAGLYKAFKMDDLSVAEWTMLSQETQQAIVKDSLSSRKNTSPQNIYEVTQLYACGALKVTCVGLRCIGFNQSVYSTVLDHASNWVQAKWTRPPTTAGTHLLTLPVLATPIRGSSPVPSQAIPTVTISPAPGGPAPKLATGVCVGVGNRSASAPLMRGSPWNFNVAEESSSSANPPLSRSVSQGGGGEKDESVAFGRRMPLEAGRGI